MLRPTFRWTRRTWYAAKHQDRVLRRLFSWDHEPPVLVARYRETLEGMNQWYPPDPLLTPLRVRLRNRSMDDDVPF